MTSKSAQVILCLWCVGHYQTNNGGLASSQTHGIYSSSTLVPSSASWVGHQRQSPIAAQHGLQCDNTKVASCLDWTTTQKTSFKWQIINMQEKIILRYRIYQTISVFSMLHTTKNARFWSMPWVNWCLVNRWSRSKIYTCSTIIL